MAGKSDGSNSSLRGANGSRECAPDDRLRDEAIHTGFAESWIASLALAMTGLERAVRETYRRSERDGYRFAPTILRRSQWLACAAGPELCNSRKRKP